MSIPTIDVRPFKALCQSARRQLQITGILQLWLSQHFSVAGNIVETGLQQRIWTADPQTTKIQIIPHFDWRPQNTEQRPTLLIKAQELKYQRLGIDNRLMGGGPPNDARLIYSAAQQGGHTVLCLAGEGGEAYQLASEVYYELMKFSPAMRAILNLLKIEPTGIGEITKLEEATENFAIPVNIAYSFMDTWEVTSLDDPVLTGIMTALRI